MTDAEAALTLDGPARILRGHMDGTAIRFADVSNQFAEVRAQFAAVGARLDAVGARIERVAGIVGDLTQPVARQDAEIAEHRRLHEEHRQNIRQVFARMEQHDARFGAMNREIRRILDTMERRGGDGSPEEP